jgi:mannose-6-phosphate isomerase-like protein (cupin superfamily)
MIDFNKYAVKKPWGWEAEIYKNHEILSLWLLNIKKDRSTSLHCHPNKRTSLNVLSGRVKITFLNSELSVTAPYKCNIHARVPHKTTALTDDVLVVESETPNNKGDLVRLKDDYARDPYKYEGSEAAFNKPSIDWGKLGISHITIRRDSVHRLMPRYRYILSSGACVYVPDTEIISVGDCLWGSDFSRVVDDLHLRFSPLHNWLTMISISDNLNFDEVRRLCTIGE